MGDLERIAQEVTQKLSRIVELEVDRRQSREHSCSNDLLYLVGTIRSRYNEALELYQEAKANSLSANMIEAEGYLRAYTQMKAFVDELRDPASESYQTD